MSVIEFRLSNPETLISQIYWDETQKRFLIAVQQNDIISCYFQIKLNEELLSVFLLLLWLVFLDVCLELVITWTYIKRLRSHLVLNVWLWSFVQVWNWIRDDSETHFVVKTWKQRLQTAPFRCKHSSFQEISRSRTEPTQTEPPFSEQQTATLTLFLSRSSRPDGPLPKQRACLQPHQQNRTPDRKRPAELQEKPAVVFQAV